MFIIFGLGEGRQHCEKSTTHYKRDSEHATSYLWASVSSFRLGSVLLKESYNPRACSLGTPRWPHGFRKTTHGHMHCLEGCICFVSLHASLFGEHTERVWHGKHPLSLSHLLFICFRVHCFVLVCYRQRVHSGDTWHFPVGQNDPKYSTFLAKLEFFPIIPRDKKEFHCTEAYFANIKLISVDDYSTLVEIQLCTRCC